MSSSNHEHSHDNPMEVHDHHHHSMRTNRIMGHVQIACGLLFGSFSLAAAGIHNELDGPVHGKRGKAEHCKNPTNKLIYRVEAGGLMIAGAIGVYMLERFVPADTVGVVTPIVFGAETIVNGHNSIRHVRSSSRSHDTRIGLGHNALDTASSLAAFALTSRAVATDSSGPMVEAIIGYGHVIAMTSLGAISIVSAVHDHWHPADTMPESGTDAE